MQTARDIMTADPITIHPDAAIADAVKILLKRGFNGLPVVDDDGLLVGVICQSDLVAQQQRLQVPSVFTLLDGFIPLPGWSKAEDAFKKMNAIIVKDAMTPNPVTASPEMHLEDIASLMVNAKFYSLPVVEDGRLLGIIGKEDILRTLVEHAEE